MYGYDIRRELRSAKAWNVELEQEIDDLAIEQFAQTNTGQFNIQINEIEEYFHTLILLLIE
jgi:hypothetical protein